MIMAWVGAFTLPWLYLQCQHALDLLVEETVDFVACHLSQHSRTVLYAAAVMGVLAGASVVGSGPLVCVSTAGAVSAGVIWWNHLRMLPQGNVGGQESVPKGPASQSVEDN